METTIKRLIATCFILFYSYSGWSQSEITANELTAHVKFLASDSLKGRKPGSIESSIAAQYIADEFKQYGLKLLGDNGFQYFDIQDEVKAGDNSFQIGKTKYSFLKDFTVLSYSENSRLTAKVVFAGYGLNVQTDSLKWNDYEKIDVKGKWVMILRGRPELDKSLSKFFQFGNDRAKVLAARDKGAIGIIFVSPVEFDKNDKLIKLETGVDNVKCGIPAVQAKRELANQILAKSGKTIELLEKSMKSNMKPASFETKAIVDIKTEVNFVLVKTQNIIAYLEGSNPVLNSEYVIIGAHFDHLGFGRQGSGSLRPDTIAVHNGADDNASGIATMLEIAQFLASKKDSLKRSVLFIAFGAEELGLVGSQYYVNHPLLDLTKAKAMLNFDMVGRLNKESKAITLSGTGTAKEWEDIFNQTKQSGSLKFDFSKEGFGSSDHSSFYSHKIPVIHFFTGTHVDYHTPNDDIELLNFAGQEEISKLGADVAWQLLTKENNLTFQEADPKEHKTAREDMKVTLGIIPGFGSSDIKGLKVEGVIKDRPAYKAGLLTGDIITAINGESIDNIYDYMERLKKYKPGDKITIDVKRGNEKKIFNVDL